MDSILLTQEQILHKGINIDTLFLEEDRYYITDITNGRSLFTGIAYKLYENGMVCYYANYKDGLKDGQYVDFYENGTIKKCQVMKENSLRGKKEQWYENGKKKEISYYVCDICLGFTKWDKTGKIMEGCYCNLSKKNLEFIHRNSNLNQVDLGQYTFVSKEECLAIQKRLAEYVLLEPLTKIDNIKYVAGVDLAYWKEEEREKAVCSIVVMDFLSGSIVEKVHMLGEIKFPYIAGYLSFRELPLVLNTIQKLNVWPDLYIFDGNGYLHPRHMGIATHASFYIHTPTIGVAKSYYKIKDEIFIMPENEVNAYHDIIVDGEVYGRAVRTHKNVKPIFVSAGNYIDLETSTEIIKRLVTKESHIPAPTRFADIDTHEQRTYYQLLQKKL